MLIGNIPVSSGMTLTVDTNGNTLTIAGAISGSSGALSKTSTGTLNLSGNNTYTGATTVSGGILQAGSSTGFSSASAFILEDIAGVSLDLNGHDNSIGS